MSLHKMSYTVVLYVDNNVKTISHEYLFAYCLKQVQVGGYESILRSLSGM